MKTVYFLFLLCAFAFGAAAQSLPVSISASGVEVIVQKWSAKKVRVVSSVTASQDPFRANDQANQAIRDRRRVAFENKIAARQGLPIKPPPFRSERLDTNPGYGSYEYVYKTKIKNTSGKTISKVTWEYVFYEKNTDREVGRQIFVTETKIKPGETETLKADSYLSPNKAINAIYGDEKPRGQYSEQVIIKSIEYTDGSISKADSK